jgi:glucosamine 6-phosphate synthetase-like amidotransferase/phosphosugar isomerase protein
LISSTAFGHEVRSTDAYSSYYAMYYRLDVKAGFTLNSAKRKIAQTISLDLQNITNHKNVFSQSYDNMQQNISTTYQLGFFPNVVYKIQF